MAVRARERRGVGFVIGLLVLVGPGTVAGVAGPRALPACSATIAHAYRVNPDVLAAIVEVESSGHPLAVSYYQDGHWHAEYPASYGEAARLVTALWNRSVLFGAGLGQVSDGHLREWGVDDPAILLDPCINLRWSAYVLRMKMNRYGNTWKAIERYNGINAAYPQKIRAVLEKNGAWP